MRNTRPWNSDEDEKLRYAALRAMTAKQAAGYIGFRTAHQVYSRARVLGIKLANATKLRSTKTRVSTNPVNDAVAAYDSVTPKKREKRCVWYKCAAPTDGIYCAKHMEESGLARRHQLIAPM